jgi:hypothetical protein
MLADPAAPALLALVLPAVVRAEDFPMAVPAHCTAAVRIAAAAAAAIITSAAATSAAATVDVAPRVPRQPVDQLLLLPALRQSRLRAELLQVRDGLRTDACVPHEASQTGGKDDRQSDGWPHEHETAELQPATNARSCDRVRSSTFVCSSARFGGPAAFCTEKREHMRSRQMLSVKAHRKCVRRWRLAAHLAGS